ncbi:hypothetical protein MANES_11G011800v8 [Manihot esculenta]|uniref:Uncharacterized protein n=1 Tax=Manihot esculenta TaxID=3983 RepID=A0A2C9UWZ3_MANES|nr:hypothetical protein MANES_11G011800v8 [Manihot esculenta]
MEGRLVVGWLWRSQNVGDKLKRDDLMRRVITTKASNRASVHGTKRPVTQTIDREEVEKEIHKGKEDKEKKIKEMEKTVDSHFRNQSEDDDHKT